MINNPERKLATTVPLPAAETESVGRSSHFVQVDRPDAVVESIHEMVEAGRVRP